MKTFLSILRGINVSGQKKIQMMDLKILYEELNFEKIMTYIQSGNVIFKNDNAKGLSKQIELKIYEKYNFKVPVIIRTSEEMQNIIKENPFLDNKDLDPNKLYFVFLEEKPGQANIDKLLKNSDGDDKFYISGKEIYLYCADGYGKTMLTNNYFENKLGVTATTRNWKTTKELAAIMFSY